MKKILSVLASTILVSTAASSVIACGDSSAKNGDSVDTIKAFGVTQDNKVFFEGHIKLDRSETIDEVNDGTYKVLKKSNPKSKNINKNDLLDTEISLADNRIKDKTIVYPKGTNLDVGIKFPAPDREEKEQNYGWYFVKTNKNNNDIVVLDKILFTVHKKENNAPMMDAIASTDDYTTFSIRTKNIANVDDATPNITISNLPDKIFIKSSAIYDNELTITLSSPIMQTTKQQEFDVKYTINKNDILHSKLLVMGKEINKKDPTIINVRYDVGYMFINLDTDGPGLSSSPKAKNFHIYPSVNDLNLSDNEIILMGNYLISVHFSKSQVDKLTKDVLTTYLLMIDDINESSSTQDNQFQVPPAL